jgi:hypothetical protein
MRAFDPSPITTHPDILPRHGSVNLADHARVVFWKALADLLIKNNRGDPSAKV